MVGVLEVSRLETIVFVVPKNGKSPELDPDTERELEQIVEAA